MYGRNNQPNTIPLILDFHTLGNIQFCLIDDKNQIRALPENATLTFAGSVKMGEISQNILFLSTTYTVSEDNVINFTVDTYTEPFLTQIKKKNTEINVEISIKFEDGHQKLLLRDYAYACPRVYIEGVPPTPVESYYTKTQVDDLISNYQPLSGMSEYALKTDIPSGSTGGSSYTFPLESRTFISTATALSEDGTIEMQNVDAQYDVDGNNYINNVTIIPSGYPSGILDFQYEEVSEFVYNPFTTFKFQIPYGLDNDYISEISIIVERDKKETIIATTEGLDDNKILRKNGWNYTNIIFVYQIVSLKNVLSNEFVSVSGDKLKLRIFFKYYNDGESNPQNTKMDINTNIQLMTDYNNKIYSNQYSFFLAINKDFENPYFINDPSEYKIDSKLDKIMFKNSLLTAAKSGDSGINSKFDQLRYLSMAINNTGIFGKLQADYSDQIINDYHYDFNTYLDYVGNNLYFNYDDPKTALNRGGIVRGFTLNNWISTDYSSSLFYLINSGEFDKLWYNFKFTPIMFIKHKILIYNPNGYSLTYSDQQRSK